MKSLSVTIQIKAIEQSFLWCCYSAVQACFNFWSFLSLDKVKSKTLTIQIQVFDQYLLFSTYCTNAGVC